MFRLFSNKNIKELYNEVGGAFLERDVTLCLNPKHQDLFYRVIKNYHSDSNVTEVIENSIKILKEKKIPYPEWFFKPESAYHFWYISFCLADKLLDLIKVNGKDLSFKNILNLTEDQYLSRISWMQLIQAYIFYNDPRLQKNHYIISRKNISPNINKLTFSFDADEYYPLLQNYCKKIASVSKMNYNPINSDKNNFNEIINKNRSEFFRVFAEKFFHEELWSELKINTDQTTAYVVGFYTVIESRCNTSSEETAKLVYNSIKDKCQVKETFDEFMVILKKMKLKCAKKGLIPVVKTNIEKNFEVFDTLYALYEEKYAPKLL